MKKVPSQLIVFLIFSRILFFLLPFFSPNWTWNRWDGPHYLYLAKYGYTNVGDPANFIVFLPLFPLLVRLGFLLFNHLEIVSSLISSALFVFASLLFYQLLRQDFSVKTATKTVVFLAVFPTSFFFSAPYAESLFLLLFSAVFWLARKKQWFRTGIALGLLSLTRPFGVLATPAVFWQWLRSKKRKPIHLFEIGLPVILAVGFYLLINKHIYGNYFAFQKILKTNWFKSMAPPWQGIVSSLKREDLMTGDVEALTSLLAWAFVPLVWMKKFKVQPAQALYYTLGVLLLTSTSYILSAPRYLLSLPPFFVVLTRIFQNKAAAFIWLVASTLGLIYLSQLFLIGQWAF